MEEKTTSKPAQGPAQPIVTKPPQPEGIVPQEAVIEDLKSKFASAVLDVKAFLNQNFVFAQPSSIVEVCRHLKESPEARYDYLVDITAIDHLKGEKRFTVVYVLYSHRRNDRLFLKTQIAYQESIPSVTGVWATANWLEREVYDMFGIEFAGHPDLKRILLPEDWHGYPLRKDYPIALQDEQWIAENLEIRK